MSKAKTEKVPKKKVQEFLADSSTKWDAELSGRSSLLQVYELKDSRVLCVFGDGSGTLWPSRDALITIIGPPGKLHVHWLEGRMTSGKDFPKVVPALLERLRERLKVPEGQLFTDETLKKVDRYFLKRVGRKHCEEPEHFEPLLAYVGEYFKAKLGGDWQMRLGFDQTTWEPWLVFKDGTEYEPYRRILRELEGPSPSIGAAVVLEVARLQQADSAPK